MTRMVPPGPGGDSDVIGDAAVVIAPGDQPPRDEFGVDWSALPVDRGDVVVVSCPPAEAEVVELSPRATIVRWPWPDPDVDQDEDAGLMVVLTDRAQRQATLWRYDPDPADRQLVVGDRIRVSIPECVVNVKYTEAHFRERSFRLLRLLKGEPEPEPPAAVTPPRPQRKAQVAKTAPTKQLQPRNYVGRPIHRCSVALS